MKDPIVIGIDVGGAKKGFHAVALKAGLFECFESKDRFEIVDWSLKHSPSVIAIDSPCKFAIPPEKSRLAERELAKKRMSSYSTPSKAAVEKSPSFEWVLNGMKLYNAFNEAFKVREEPVFLIETFPHAVACSLAGKVVRANVLVRSKLLTDRRFDLAPLNQCADTVDAALCAIAARAFALEEADRYGREADGFIVTPPWNHSTATPTPPIS